MVSGCLTIRVSRVGEGFSGSAVDSANHLSLWGRDYANHLGIATEDVAPHIALGTGDMGKHLSLYASLVCSVYIGSFSTDFTNAYD